MDIENTTQIKKVRDTIVILRELNTDEKLKQEVYYREKRLHDEASALGQARREGMAERKLEIVKNLRKMGMTEEQIKIALGNN